VPPTAVWVENAIRLVEEPNPEVVPERTETWRVGFVPDTENTCRVAYSLDAVAMTA
jgi:hypothetical protein